MTNAVRDDNHIPVMIGMLNTDGTTPKPIQAASHVLQVDDDITGTDHGPDNAEIDANMVKIGMGVSSADGETPVAIYINSSGKLLVKSA